MAELHRLLMRRSTHAQEVSASLKCLSVIYDDQVGSCLVRREREPRVQPEEPASAVIVKGQEEGAVQRDTDDRIEVDRFDLDGHLDAGNEVDQKVVQVAYVIEIRCDRRAHGHFASVIGIIKEGEGYGTLLLITNSPEFASD